MAGSGFTEPVTQAIVNARDSAIGDRVIGGIALVSFFVSLLVVLGSFGYQPYGAAKVFGCFAFSGMVTYLTYRFIKRINRKRAAALEADIRAAKELETQRQLSAMRAKQERENV